MNNEITLKAKNMVSSVDDYTWAEINSLLRELNNQKNQDAEAKYLWSKLKLRSSHIREEYLKQIDSQYKTSKAKKRSVRKGYIDSIDAILLKLTNKKPTGKELTFVSDIKRKSTLTTKQVDWLKSIASDCDVSIDLDSIKVKESKFTTNNNSCNHEDLGSLGYSHGSIVACPHCGSMVEVW